MVYSGTISTVSFPIQLDLSPSSLPSHHCLVPFIPCAFIFISHPSTHVPQCITYVCKKKNPTELKPLQTDKRMQLSCYNIHKNSENIKLSNYSKLKENSNKYLSNTWTKMELVNSEAAEEMSNRPTDLNRSINETSVCQIPILPNRTKIQ